MIGHVHGRDVALLALPATALLVLFVLLPATAVTVLAFFDWDPLRGGGQLVGLRNFSRMLSDGQLQAAVAHTLLYALFSVPTTLVVGLVVALAIHAVPRWADVWRTAYFIPMASTLAASSVVWQWLFYPRSGLIDATIGRLTGVTGWLESTELALAAVAVVGCWHGFPGATIMFLAGLAGVPRVTLEAARLDGANAWSRFWHVTWPALGPATVFALVIASRDALRVFDQVRVMTDGGPMESTVTLSFLMWRRGIQYSDVGGASVVDLVLLALVLLITLVHLRTIGARWERAGSR
jgi:multiple sugar transport system permease protein